jgi:predicted flap endonuclease-1-like 5' DNA nuclease
MKKIGVLFGMENTFPFALIERINEKNIPGIHAEPVLIDQVRQGETSDYAVIIDRISQDVPFYRSFLKNAALSGTAVINNPFWWSADEKFINNTIAMKVGVPVPNTALLPSKQMPTDTQASSFRNLQFPMDWESLFNYTKFPAYMKPHDGGGWKSVYKVKDLEDFFEKYGETEQLVMMIQSEVVFEEYFRCYCLGGKRVHIMPYEPTNPHHLRYVTERPPASKELLDLVHDYVLRLNHALGYDFNTVEFGIMDGIPYAIDFCNPAPDADLYSVGQENFDWIVENAAEMAIERAQAHRDGEMNLTWGTVMQQAIAGQGLHFAPQTATKVTSKTSTGSVTTTTRTVQTEKPKAIKSEKPDDLKIIEGIGPKIEELLHAGGYKSFESVAAAQPADIKKILDAAGPRFKMHDPATWSKQAALAAKGDFASLEKLKSELSGGKTK